MGGQSVRGTMLGRLSASAGASAVVSLLPESARRAMAGAARGDALAPVTARIRRSLAPASAGTVPYGPTLHPLVAAIVSSFDAHSHSAETVSRLGQTVSDADLAYVCSPPLGAAPRQIVVRADDAAAAARALTLTLTAPGWYARRLRGTTLVGRPAPLSSSEWHPWLTDGGARIFQAVAAEVGTVLGEADLGCDLQGWRVIETESARADEGVWEPGTVVAPTRNDWAPFLPPATWHEASTHASHVPEVLRHPGVFDVTEPVDVVFTWVDSEDPHWRARREAAEPRSGQHHPGALDPVRFESADELRYALRSIHYYASWVRQIFLVTAGQVPSWLDRDHPGVRVIDHREIFPAQAEAVFNSHAIESRLHHVPDLAEHYLYLNDDVMFGRRAFPEDFYVGDGVIRFGVSTHLLDPSPPTVVDPPIMAAAKNGRALLGEQFRRSVRHKVRHTAHPQLRSVVALLEQDNQQKFAEMARSTFRAHDDISVASSLQLWFAASLGRAVPGDVDLLYLDVGAPSATRILSALLTTRQHQVLCLNASRSGPERAQDIERLQTFLDLYYPLPAPWERRD